MKRIVPDPTQMRRYLEAGLNQSQIVDRYEAETGVKCSRSAIGMAIKRYGMESAQPRARFRELLPWPLPKHHQMQWEARMLRLEGRRRKGLKMTDKETRDLTNWLATLDEKDAVVAYNPKSEQGFFLVPKREGEDLIRVEPIV